MENKKSLNAAELGELWVSYMNASLSSKVFAYFLEKVEDEEINGVIKDAYALSQSALQFITGVFEQDGIPQPVAFTDEDVNVNAPRLFTDNFFLQYIHEYAFLGMTETTTSINRASRQDIYQFYSESYLKFNKLHEKALSVMVSKGVYANPPSIPTPEKIDFVKKQNFLTGWFGERRALLAVEIAGLYSNIQRNLLGATVLTGFSQAATLKEVRQFMLRGIDIANKWKQVMFLFRWGQTQW